MEGVEMNQNWKDLPFEEKKAYVERFTLMDDYFMTAVLGSDKACVEVVIRVVLAQEDLSIERVIPQAVLANLSGHSVRLDILATDAKGTQFDIEIQRSSKGASRRRARYYSSMLDAAQTLERQDYETLHDTRVIFFTEQDVLGLNRQCYRIQRMIVGEEDAAFEDGAQIIYVNCALQSEGEIGRLAHDFQCSDPDKMYYETLSKAVRRFKRFYEEDAMDTVRNERGLTRQEIAEFWENHWCSHFREAFEKGREEGIEEGREEGIEKGREEGREEERLELLSQLMRRNHLSAESVVDQFSFSPDARAQMILALKEREREAHD